MIPLDFHVLLEENEVAAEQLSVQVPDSLIVGERPLCALAGLDFLYCFVVMGLELGHDARLVESQVELLVDAHGLHSCQRDSL